MKEILVACHCCDLLQREPEVPEGGSALCLRCHGELWRHRPNSLDRTLALAIAGLLLFAVANSFSFLGFSMQGQETETTLSTGIRELYAEDQYAIASLVLLTTIVAPAAQLGLLLYLLGPIRLGIRVPGFALAFRCLQRVRGWSMMEVFLIGILVSIVKLSDMARIETGPSLWAFVLLIPVVAGALAAFDPRVFWDSLESEG